MIKIKLDRQRRKEIEGILIKDLYGNEENKKGKLVSVLEAQESRDFLHKDYIELYNYFYDENENLKYGKVKEILLADKAKMEVLIEEFGCYDCYDDKVKRLSDDLLNKIFRYENFSKRKVAYEIMRKMDVMVCPYCNRLYTVTLKDKKVRPQFDHYFPKKKYPYLALSLYNLIPSCSICNMAKSDMDTIDTPVLYPYEEEFGEKVKFAVEWEDDFVKYIRGISDKIHVLIENPEHVLEEKVNNQDSRLHITELYNEHKDYIQDIFKNFYINTDKRVAELLHKFPSLFSTKEEIRSLMFMNDIRKENWGKRPFAKLTHDIYVGLKEMKG